MEHSRHNIIHIEQYKLYIITMQINISEHIIHYSLVRNAETILYVLK